MTGWLDEQGCAGITGAAGGCWAAKDALSTGTSIGTPRSGPWSSGLRLASTAASRGCRGAYFNPCYRSAHP